MLTDESNYNNNGHIFYISIYHHICIIFILKWWNGEFLNWKQKVETIRLTNNFVFVYGNLMPISGTLLIILAFPF